MTEASIWERMPLTAETIAVKRKHNTKRGTSWGKITVLAIACRDVEWWVLAGAHLWGWQENLPSPKLTSGRSPDRWFRVVLEFYRLPEGLLPKKWQQLLRGVLGNHARQSDQDADLARSALQCSLLGQAGFEVTADQNGAGTELHVALWSRF